MTETTISIFEQISIHPSEDQAKALYRIEEFLSNPFDKKAFVLRGSAGTGKTTMMKIVVEYLKKMESNFILLAPTAKAVKVLSNRTKEIAQTIHSLIYLAEELEDGRVKFHTKHNENDSKTVYIIDEASMLPSEKSQNEDFIAPNPLLTDLISFIKEGNTENQMIFIGDIYQLPPFAETESVALSARRLNEKYNISTEQTTLTKVLRQAENSPVLRLANEIKIRKDTNKDLRYISLQRKQSESDAISEYLSIFDKSKHEKAVFIAMSNIRVQELNFRIRERLGLIHNTLSVGDVVMMHQNWIGKMQNIAKGEVGIVIELSVNTEVVADLIFVDAIIDFEGKKVKAKILIDTLLSEKGEINGEMIKALKGDRMRKNENYRKTQKASDDSFMGAMHLRYGYAITCNKAQGSEWETVFIDPKFHPTNHKWLYTAVTRAVKDVYSWWY